MDKPKLREVELSAEEEEALDRAWASVELTEPSPPQNEGEPEVPADDDTKSATKGMSAEVFFLNASAIKATGNGRIHGYLVAFGLPRDKQGEYFDTDTNYHLDWYGDGPRPVLFHHGVTRDAKADAIGHIVSLTVDDKGILAEAELDMLNPLARKVYELVEAGRIGWSSGSLPHLVKVDGDGRIKEWPIVEASLTPAPAEPHRTSVQALKTANTALGLDAFESSEETIETNADGAKAVQDTSPQGADTGNGTQNQGRKSMDPKLLIAALEKAGVSSDQIVTVLKSLGGGVAVGTEAPPEEAPPEDGMMADPDKEVLPEEEKPVDEENKTVKAAAKAAGIDADTLARAIKAVMQDQPGESRTGAYQAPKDPAPTGRKSANIQVFSKYRGLKAADMDFLRMLRAANARGSNNSYQPEPAFVREMASKAWDEFEKDQLPLDEDAARRVFAIKSNEVASTGQATDAGNWIPTLWSADLWETARIDNAVLSNLQTVEMPTDSYELPVEGTDPTVYAVAETTAASELALTGVSPFTTSKLAANKVTLNAAKLGLQSPFSAEVNEDSIIQFIPQLRAQAMRAFQDAIDNVILNADVTTGTGNINYKGANTSAAPKSKWLYGGGDGIRHLCLVDGSGLTLDAAGSAPTLSLLRKTLAKMANAYSVQPANICMFVDVKTYHKMKSIDELLVYMNNGRGSTVNDGLVPTIDGSPVFPSAELALTDSTGYAMAAGTGTLGQVLFVYKPGWKVGFRRQITSTIDFLAWLDTYVLTMTVRMALARRDAYVASLLYNVSID